ncbi:MAG TPA: ABC transporter permease, partial [Rhodothermales bacterium]|nr:ABC transporter permease [Rhodothermales bacterium]
APVAVLSYDLWQRRYQGKHDVLDDSLLINNTPHAIVGVMPADFQMYYQTDAFAPFTFAPGQAGAERKYLAAGRLRAGVTQATAADALQALHGADDPVWRIKLRSVQDVYGEPVRSQLFVYLGLMTLLLLLACMHVFRQHWSRLMLRQKSWIQGVGTSWGASPLLVGLIEALLVALAGGLLGLGVARLMVNSLLGPLLGDFAHLFDIHIDARVLCFALSLSVMLGLAMGLWPFIVLRKRTGARTRSSSQGRRTEGALLALEIALALVLLVTAGLMGRSLLDRHNTELGFDPGSMLTTPMVISGPQYATGRTQAAYFAEVFSRLDTLQGVQAASLTLVLPGIDPQPRVSIFLEKQAPATAQQAVHFNVVGTDYLDMMGVALRRGRLFEPEDAGSAVGVTVINEAMATHLWPGQDPVGQHLFLNNPSRERVEVIGVVGNVQQGGWHPEATPAMYGLYWRVGGGAMHLVVKAEIDPQMLVASIEETLRSIDKQVPLEPLAPMEGILARQARTDFLFVAVFMVLGLVALAMAALSLRRSLIHAVHLRSREIGMRRLLGATTYDVQLLALRPFLGRLAAGVAIGLIGAALITPFFVGLLFEGDPLDPVAYASGALLLAGALLVVACASARKAAHLDPILALRYG